MIYLPATVMAWDLLDHARILGESEAGEIQVGLFPRHGGLLSLWLRREDVAALVFAGWPPVGAAR